MNKIVIRWCGFSLCCCFSTASLAQTFDAFMQNLNSLCGARFEGEMTFPNEGQDSFEGKLLVAEFADCSDIEMAIPFAVGEDTSRTWLVSAVDGGLQLKHDHRHADGTPDEISMYGGRTAESGSANQQSFAADEYTKRLIPEASTNVWSLSLNDDKTTLTYHLERHQKPRFTAILKRVEVPQ